MPDVFNRHGFGPSVAVKQLSSCSWVDHLRFGSTTSDWSAHFGLAFASPPAQNALGSPLIVTRRLIKQKARGHPATSTNSLVIEAATRSKRLPLQFVFELVEVAGLPHLVSTSFQVLFHSAHSGSFHLSLAVLVHYRSPMSS